MAAIFNLKVKFLYFFIIFFVADFTLSVTVMGIFFFFSTIQSKIKFHLGVEETTRSMQHVVY